MYNDTVIAFGLFVAQFGCFLAGYAGWQQERKGVSCLRTHANSLH